MILFSSSNGTVRRHASFLLALLLRENFLSSRRGGERVVLAATIAVNRLSDPSLKLPFSPALFAESLAGVRDTCAAFSVRDKKFHALADELCSTVRSVLENMARIKEFSYDQELLADLYCKLCDSYRASSPDLRASWLDTLAFLHEVPNCCRFVKCLSSSPLFPQSNQHYEEAAQCRIHLAALVSTYLSLVRPGEAVPVDSRALAEAAPNVAPEFEAAKSIATEEGVCASEFFSRAGLFRQLQDAARLLREESLFESCIIVERLQAAVFLRNRNWAELATTMDDLARLCDCVIRAEEEKNRMFAKWYRVTLAGTLFGAEPQKWIYKEKPDVMIVTIVDRLKAQFALATGSEDKVHVLSPQEPLPSSLLPDHVYVQVWAVTPLTQNNSNNSATSNNTNNSNTSRSNNVANKFVSESPFTVSGKTHGNWDEQCLKKVVVTTQRVIRREKKFFSN
jgi:hypothetical protein